MWQPGQSRDWRKILFYLKNYLLTSSKQATHTQIIKYLRHSVGLLFPTVILMQVTSSWEEQEEILYIAKLKTKLNVYYMCITFLLLIVALLIANGKHPQFSIICSSKYLDVQISSICFSVKYHCVIVWLCRFYRTLNKRMAQYVKSKLVLLRLWKCASYVLQFCMVKRFIKQWYTYT